MGMDVYGINPTSEEGQYFRASVWSWHPMADFVTTFWPDLTRPCKNWHTNDGDGLGASDSRALGLEIERALSDGRFDRYARERQAYIDSLPRETCEYCGGTGIRTDAVAQEYGFPTRLVDSETSERRGQIGYCNACDSNGWKPPFESLYILNKDRIQVFAAFLKDCGGFRIC